MNLNITTIAVLLTCHNRKDKTLQCLHSLYAQQGLGIDFNAIAFLVDDGSTDCTTEAIKIEYPSVNIIQGDGNLYWNRGMHLAWEAAAAKYDFDYYLWLNDDTFLHDNALKILFKSVSVNGIICGSTHSAMSDKITYGGFLKNPDRLIIPNGEYQSCDYFNGNCVLIPKMVFELVGNLDPFFQHALGDFDYGLRAKKCGVNLYIAPKFIGLCESHTELPKWMSSSISLTNRIKHLYSAASGCCPPEFFVYDKRHNGLFSACFHYFTIHLRVIFPNLRNGSNLIN